MRKIIGIVATILLVLGATAFAVNGAELNCEHYGSYHEGPCADSGK